MLFKGKGCENIVCSRKLKFTELIQALRTFRSCVHSKIHDSSLIHFYGRWSGIYKLFKMLFLLKLLLAIIWKNYCLNIVSWQCLQMIFYSDVSIYSFSQNQTLWIFDSLQILQGSCTTSKLPCVIHLRV